MMDYIRRLRLCIKWFQEIEGGYLLEQENLREMVESVENKCDNLGMLIEVLVLVLQLGDF